MGKIAWKLSAVAMLCLSPAAAAVIYDFESVPLGTTTPFMHPGSVPAVFTSPGSAPVFFVGPSFFSTLTGNVLVDADPAANTLDIIFSSPVNAISFLFALNGPPDTSTITVTAYCCGGSGPVVGSASAMGTIPAGFGFPEGSLSLSGLIFTRATITSTATDFAVDDVTVNPIPEPASGGVVLLGLASVIALVKRRVPARR